MGMFDDASSAVSSLPGEITGANAIASGLRDMSTATDHSVAEMLRMFGMGKDVVDPYAKAGIGYMTEAGNRLTAGFDPSKLAEDPAYADLLKRGQAGVLAGAGKTGSPWSGAAMEDLSKFNMSLADQYGYQRWMDQIKQLSGLAGIGAQAAESEMGGAVATGRDVGNALTAQGSAAAGAGIAQVNARNQLLGGGMQAGMTGAVLASALA